MCVTIWVWAVNEENWPTVKGKKIWAVDSRKKAEKIKKADNIVFYVTGTKYFQGIFEVANDWKEPTVDWPDGRETVLEVQLKEVTSGYAHIDRLKELDFIKGHQNIGLALKASSYGPSNSSKPITESDQKKILDELKRVPAEPTQDEEPLPAVDTKDFVDDTFTPYNGQVRLHIVKSMFYDLLGPKMGPGEIIENPYDQYTLGILKSIYKSNETKQEPEPTTDPSEKLSSENNKTKGGDLDFGNEEDEEKYLVDADLNPMQGARSMGLSFVVQGDDPKVKICCTWGRYENEAGLPISVMKRYPNFYVSDFVNVSKGEQIFIPEKDPKAAKEISKTGIEIHFRSTKIRNSDNQWNVSIFLVNKTPFADRQRPEHFVFQPQIRVSCGDATETAYQGRTTLSGDLPAKDDLLFWHRNSKGKGHLCSVIWKEIDPECQTDEEGRSFSDFSWPDASSSKISQDVVNIFKKADIRTEFLPCYTILQPDLLDSPVSFDASELSELWKPEQISGKFDKIVSNYNSWIEEKDSQLKSEDKFTVEIAAQARKNLDECRNVGKRISDGIKLLVDDEKARLSFCFMNKVMSDKRRWDNRNRSDKDKKLLWYEFQMAFILQTLSGVIPGDDDGKNTCDVLWFPTGGGKTEAYLGLMVFAFAYRRLLDLDHFELDGGVSVISRYTLRLLTIQQFTRALGAIVAADLRRVQNWIPTLAKLSDPHLIESLAKGKLWGKTRFSLGVWIGNLTPNRFKIQPTRLEDIQHAEGALLPEYKRRRGSSPDSEPAQVMECPCCGNTLSVPSEKELKPDEEIKSLTWVIKTDESIKDLESIPDVNFNGDHIELLKKDNKPAKSFYEINSDDSDGTKYYGFNVNFRSTTSRLLTDKRIDKWWWIHVKTALGYRDNEDPLQSTKASRPGYFFLYKEGDNKPFDFAIHCTNKDCELNKGEWFEKVTVKSIPPIARPFQKPGKQQTAIYLPISAFTVDEQVYSRCPTVVIATADKFARLPFEPRAASIFGNVDFHNTREGYGRGNPNEDPARETVKKFLPPSLIIQDELHLIEGPLGSMVGLYEMAIDVLSSTQGFTPKYIASTATIKEAASQVGTIYRRGVSIFPPQGISYGDNYFSIIKEDPSCLSEKAGRLYIGILAPKGTLIVPVKIWASLLSSVHRIRANPKLFGLDQRFKASNFTGTFEEFVDRETDWYWTLIGYFNAVRELSIARSLYNADILRDVKKWSQLCLPSISHRFANVRLMSSLRYIPIKIKTGTIVTSLSVYCKNRQGSLSIAVYDNENGKNEPRNLLRKTRDEDAKKECREDENEFILDEPLEVKEGDLLWIAIFNYSEKTLFQTGLGIIKSRITLKPKIVNDVVVFTDKSDKSREITTTIRTDLKTKARELDPVDAVELSSATDSLELPEIMEGLQRTPSSIDCLFTTSMFGTGIDIDRLGLMTVMGQPKSTSSYIQSTGRVGRKCPGLVVTWLRAGRVRDLNHYENFVGYHRAIHRFVEPISAAPFSEETMNLCLGPVVVAILRNARSVMGKPVSPQWREKNIGPGFMAQHSEDDEIKAIKEALQVICNSKEIAPLRKPSSDEAKEIIERTITKWRNSARLLAQHGESMIYEEYTMIRKAKENVVLGTPQHKIAGKSVVYKNTRTSLRDVESTTTIGDSGWAGSN